jgi:hypothetical protein
MAHARRITILLRWLAIAGAAHGCAMAQEFTAGAGASRAQSPEARNVALSLGYDHDLAGPLFAKGMYLNEGHLARHHRDGFALQLGLRAPTGIAGLSASIAAGPYRYFDTEAAETPDGYANAHGWAGLYSAALTWVPHPGSRLFYQLRYDRVQGHDPPNANMLVANVGWKLDNDGDFRSYASGTPRLERRNEAVAYSGLTIINSFESQSSTAFALEYRRDFSAMARGSVTVLHEADTRLVRRNGVIVEGWIEPTFMGGTFSTGVGIGPYVAVDYDDHPHVFPILSLGASWRFANGWTARFTWHRSSSSNDRDSDVLLLGVGYRF